ncbi:hypothetical protein Cob_v007555 [Colletotrichum orbiculare MAFF 240422]|uniref:Uncharacterized protein n=1 Tax=Colletotrichum orbiculare (strain 104-T / ATCC 96160 / CBS 514.97 / LARS 414 / MAFF 240422) TaxID=1213857 RepID=N4VN40_COLOR|nr:hypothetical protein Cob_v007555 [Colletotrichum orbiculare MAFF 240422]
MKTSLLAAAALATSAAAQDREISSCSALSCLNPESQGVCASGNSSRSVGVGMASEALDVSDEKLSLTLVDGSPDGILAIQEGYQFSTQTLYVGVPPNFDSSTQQAGCALMMQYQEQTFELSDDNTQNTTSCRSVLSDGCQNDIAGLVRQFRYAANGRSSGTGSVSPLRCQAVVPESYELRRVAEMRQILPTGENGGQSLGGRSGVTPVFAVLYSDENDDSPEVQFTCMRTFTAEGEEMPDTLNGDDTSGAVSTGYGAAVAFVATLVSFVFLLG